MNRTQIAILKQMHQERLARLLQRLDRLALPPHLARRRRRQDVHADLAHEARERQLEEEEIRAGLVAPDFAEGGRAGAPAVGFAGWDGVAGCGWHWG